LVNPAKPAAIALGVANERIHQTMAEVMASKGCDGFIFRGDDGLDEITLNGSTTVLAIGGKNIVREQIDARDFGLENAPLSAIVGGDGAENAAISMAIFRGEKGAPRDVVLLNAAVTIAAFEGNLDEPIQVRISKGLERATNAIDSGAALDLVAKWGELSRAISPSASKQ
jgi:anthranilate phosphoribosyltransferase